MTKQTKVIETGCCPRFNPKMWQNKTFVWKNKLFFKDRVKTFFYMPLNINRVMGRLFKATQDAGSSFEDGLTLSDHTSKWNMDVYVAAKKRIKGLENVTISGKFYTRVYEGPYSDTKYWSEDFEKHMAKKKLKYKKLFMWYTTCPHCAKIYGKSYVVFVAQID